MIILNNGKVLFSDDDDMAQYINNLVSQYPDNVKQWLADYASLSYDIAYREQLGESLSEEQVNAEFDRVGEVSPIDDECPEFARVFAHIASTANHRGIYDALAERDPELAESYLAQNRNLENQIADMLTNTDDKFRDIDPDDLDF